MRVLRHRWAVVWALVAVVCTGAPPRRTGSALRYSSFLGTSNQDAIIGVKVDPEGMVYVVGYTDSAELTALPGAYQATSGGGRDIFVAKFNPALGGPDSLVYLSYFGGSGTDTPTAMTLDAQGYLYITGSTNSPNFPIGGEAPQTALNGPEDAFVVKLNLHIAPAYALAFSTVLGGSGQEVAHAIDVDASGAIYVAGVTNSEDLPLAGTTVQAGLWGPQDGFLAKLDPARNAPRSLVYNSYVGGSAVEECRAVAVTPEGRVYVSGTTKTGENFFVHGTAFQPTYGGNGDIFLMLLDLSRPGWESVRYSTFLGGSSVDEVRKVAVVPGGGVVLTGYTLSTDFPVTPDAFQGQAPGNGDVFVTVLDPSRTGAAALVYSTYFGGHTSEVAYDVAADAERNIYLTGYTLSGDLPVTSDAFQGIYSGGVDAFAAKLSLALPPAQALVYGTFAGGGGINVAYGIAVAPDGAIYLAGRSLDQAFPITEGALQPSYAGGFSDGFILGLGRAQ